MPGPYTKGAQNAETLFSLFDLGDVVAGSTAIAINATNATVTHGLSGTPDWILLGTPEEQLVNRIPYAASIGATTFLVAHSDTDGAAQTVYYIAGVLS